MKKIILFGIFSLVICLTSGQVNNSYDSAPPEPIPPPQSTAAPITTSKPLPPSSTEKPTTSPPTEKPTTPRTEKPTTSPTEKPTTAPTTTSTVPPTTTTAAPTTTGKPTPKPKPEIGAWSFNYTGSNKTCMIVKMALEISISYERSDNKTGNASLIVPSTADSTGHCELNNTNQNFVLSWSPIKNLFNTISFNFAKNETEKKFMLSAIEVEVNPDGDHFPNMTSNATIKVSHKGNEFKTPLKMSYRCKPKENFNLTTSNAIRVGKLTFTDVQMEAFHDATGETFNTAKDCETSETSGIVPIAVGCSLGALIVIVVIAYLIGRRRSQARGYLSMFSEKQRDAEYIPMKNISCFGK